MQTAYHFTFRWYTLYLLKFSQFFEILNYTWVAFFLKYLVYSRVLNKRGGVRIIGGGGWKWFDITIIGDWNNRGGGAWKNRK